MDTTNFDMNGKVYRRVQDGSPVDFVYVTQNGELEDTIYLLDSRREHFFESYDLSQDDENNIVIKSNEYPVEFTLRPVEMGDIAEYFKDSIRTFKDVAAGERIIKEQLLANPYEENTSDETIFSVSISDSGDALELLMEDGDGNLFYRSEGDWVEVDSEENHPTIFDQKFITIEKSDNDAIVSIWDETQTDGEDLREEDILPFAAVYQ